MLIRHVMERDVFTLAPRSKCREALRKLNERRIRHAPVLEEKRLVGVVSERDLLRQLPGTVQELEGDPGWEAEQSLVGAVMKTDVTVCSPNEAIDEAARRMLQAKLGCLPVIKADRLVGIVTTSDLLRGFAALTEEGGVRISLLVPPVPAGKGASYDPAHACGRLGLRLLNLMSMALQGGGRICVLHVDAPNVDALTADALAAGCNVLQAATRASSSPAASSADALQGAIATRRSGRRSSRTRAGTPGCRTPAVAR